MGLINNRIILQFYFTLSSLSKFIDSGGKLILIGFSIASHCFVSSLPFGSFYSSLLLILIFVIFEYKKAVMGSLVVAMTIRDRDIR